LGSTWVFSTSVFRISALEIIKSLYAEWVIKALDRNVEVMQMRKLGALIALVMASFVLFCEAASAESAVTNLQFDANAGYGVYDAEGINNRNIGGVLLMMDWSSVEVQKGVYDFGPADKQAEAWTRAGKKLVIVIRYTRQFPGNCQKDQNWPVWVISQVPHHCDAVAGNVIPNYFDASFKAELKTYVKAVGDHFARSPYRDSILYVRIGVGLGSEGFYLTPCRRNAPCDFERGRDQLRAWGFTPTIWAAWQREMMSYYKSVFPYTHVIYPIVRLDTDPSTGNPIQMDLAFWAAENGMGIGAQGLSPRFADGPARIRYILQTIHSRNSTAWIQLQTVRPVANVDEMIKDMALARELGAKAVEWYSGDANRKEYQEQLSAFRNGQ
jgi:hypothetical protein